MWMVTEKNIGYLTLRIQIRPSLIFSEIKMVSHHKVITISIHYGRHIWRLTPQHKYHSDSLTIWVCPDAIICIIWAIKLLNWSGLPPPAEGADVVDVVVEVAGVGVGVVVAVVWGVVVGAGEPVVLAGLAAVPPEVLPVAVLPGGTPPTPVILKIGIILGQW